MPPSGKAFALGSRQAQALAHRADLIGRDNAAMVSALERWTEATLGPRYRRQVEIDAAMLEGMRPG